MNKFQRAAAKILGIRASETDARGDIANTAGANSLFGTIGSNLLPLLAYMDFIPSDGKGTTISLTDKRSSIGANWIGLESKQMQFWAYNLCSQVSSVIDRLAEADSNGIIRFVDSDTLVPLKTVNKSPKLSRLNKLFKKPNPWQTWEEFDGEQAVISRVFGYCPVLAVGGNSGLDRTFTKALINLNPLLVTPNRNEEFSPFKDNGLIKNWTLRWGNGEWNIPSEDIILIKDGFIGRADGLGLPISKLHGLDWNVSNILAAMEADNVLLKKKGPLGIFSFDPGKDMAGSTPYDPKAKDALQTDLQRYGLTIGQLQHIISGLPIKWNDMSYNLRDLTTKETIRQGTDGVCDRFGYPAELMSGKNATYENRNSSEKWLYNNNVIPFSIRKMAIYTEYFQLDGVKIMKDYDHLPVLQEDIVKAGEASKYEAEGLDIEWKSGMITWNQWQTARGRDAVVGMDIYYPDYLKLYPSMVQNNPSNSKKPDNGKKEDASKDSGTQE